MNLGDHIGTGNDKTYGARFERGLPLGLRYVRHDLVNNGKTTQTGLDVLGRGGKLVLVGVGGGEIALSTASLIFKPRSIIGSATGSLNDLKAVIDLAKSGKLAAVPVNKMHKDQANEAMDRLEHGQVTGRIVLTS